MRKTLLSIALSLAGASWAAVIDGIQPGVTPLSQAKAAVSRMAASAQSGYMPIESAAARAEQAFGITSISTTFGETSAALWLAAGSRGTVQYLRLHVEPKHRDAALRALAQKYSGRKLDAESSDETGITDIFFYDIANVAWVRGPSSSTGLEIIVGSYEMITTILTEDVGRPEWATALMQARANLGRR